MLLEFQEGTWFWVFLFSIKIKESITLPWGAHHQRRFWWN
jgi:hypothetical protein